MERHHEMELATALDRLYLEGATSIPWDQLYLWFNAERLNKGSYRDLLRRWEELCTVTYRHNSAPKLSVLHGNGKSTLTLLREPFDGERRVSLIDWT